MVVVTGGMPMSSDERPALLHTMTNTLLLEGLRGEGDGGAWRRFVDRYLPMIERYARRFGLSDADAQDAAQQALIAFCSSFREGNYDREKGRLRFWLFGIARNQIRNHLRGLQRREKQIAPENSQTDFFARQVDEGELERAWDEEWRQAVLRQCLDEVRRTMDPRSVEAFELFAWKGHSAQDVAERLGLTANAVFIAKHRVMKRIRELLPQMEEIW